jgi:hypothetical protein
MVCARAREQLRVLLFQDRANSPGQFRLRNCGELRSFWFEMLSITETEHARCDKLLCDAEASRECSSEGSGPAEGSGLTENLSGLFVDGFILKELFFSLEPVVQFRTGLITSPDVVFVGPSPDSFFG